MSSYTYESENTHCICFNCSENRLIDEDCSCGAPTMRVQSKRNLMNELTEGIDALAEKRQQDKKRVYIVFVDDYNRDRNFCDVFFTEDAARQYISKRSRPRSYGIEVFEETDDGCSKEIH